MQFSVKELQAASVDHEKVLKQMSSNIGDVGISVDFSQNTLRNPMQNNHPLLAWLMNTTMSTMARNSRNRGLSSIHKDENGDWQLMLPFSVYTLPPTDTQGACCWVPFDIAKCGGLVPLHMLCLKDCENIMDSLINMNRVGGGTDLIGQFLRQGETVQAARRRMARMSMSFFTARNVILGVSNAGTDVLKPFHGLLEVMEDVSVVKILGTDPLAAFDSLYCRLQVLGAGNYAIAVHPLTYQGIAAMVQPGRFDRLPDGWTRSGDTIRFRGIQFIQDKAVPVDLTGGVGEAWILDGETTGMYLATDLSPTDNFVRHGFASTDDPAQGCASECDFYYNLGAAFNNNPNRLAVITDIPLSANCLGTSLQGLDGLITPNTLVPQ